MVNVWLVLCSAASSESVFVSGKMMETPPRTPFFVDALVDESGNTTALTGLTALNGEDPAPPSALTFSRVVLRLQERADV